MLPDRFKWVGVSSLWAYRFLTWAVIVAGLMFAGTVLGLRYWALPKVESHRDDIARFASARTGQKVTIGAINANWDGLHPQLKMANVTVHDAAGRPALEFERVDITASWLSLLTFELRLYAADIYRPRLSIRRDPRGVVSIAGIEMTGGKGDGGFADWVLRHRDIEIHDATLVWNDEQRAAPPLELSGVSLQLYNRGRQHRFGLRATPPRGLASPIDVRGNFTGETVRAIEAWNGRLFVQLDYADIAAWRTWLTFPIEFPRGAGALRAWLTFSDDRLVEAIADVRLADVLTRLAPEVPALDLRELSGRIGWKQSATEFEITTSRLALLTTGGLALEPTDFLLRMSRSDKRRAARGELSANALDLDTLAVLADHLPFQPEARKQLAQFSPRGSVHDMVVRWTGEWREPAQYSVRGRFRGLAVHHAGRVPGFSGVSGTVEANERGGTLAINSNRATVDMPRVFRDAHEFEALAAQVNWTRSGGETDLKLNSVSFSNTHLAGTVFGNYRTAGPGAGTIDLTGSLTRADARYVGRYIPLAVGKNARDWLDAAFIAGQSSDVSLRLKGDLDHFPFPEGKGGVFQVAAKVTGGKLHYGDGWPDIENIAGDLVFRGKRMDVRARQGSIFGVRLQRVHVEIPDLLAGEEMLNVNGEAEGPTADFFAFIDKSPVQKMIDQFTHGWQAKGSGKLSLKLAIPLRAMAKSRVAGSYQFAGNSVVIAPELPVVEQASGRVDFTQSTVRAQNLTATVLGGPTTITASSAADGAVRVNVQGRINADVARRSAGNPFWAQHLRGSADWRALLTARKRDADVVIESSLQGLAADLPAPLAKTAADLLPFRFERRLLPGNQDRLSVSFGEVVSANLLRRTEGAQTTIHRGVVRFGGPAGEPDRAGVWVSGSVKVLDLDRWLALLRQGGGDTRIEWGSVDLKLGTVDVLGRHFGEHAVSGTAQGGQWRGSISGKEVDGSFNWQSQGRGKLTGRMKSLAIPAAASKTAAGSTEKEKEKTAGKEADLPALDLVAEQFVNKGKALGRLELQALPENRDWRIERLRIANPDGTLTVDGLWQISASPARTRLNLRLETGDAGKLLVRLGYPEGLRRGTAKLGGALSWVGAPYDLDFPTLSGNLVLEAAKGQFVKLEPGIGKLLGILSLQALPRRISLDFRDVFSEGFAFDEIVGTTRIGGGVAAFDKFRIQGPAALVLMSGEVDLARETQNLRVRIAPQVSDTVALAGALVGGPVAGVAAYLAQKVLKDPLSQMVSYEYGVTGTWAEPSVKRINVSAPAADQDNPQ